jgi:hypothetical protein
MDSGPLIDICSIERNYREDETYSLLAINVSLRHIYIEFFGVVMISTFDQKSKPD